MYPFSLFVRANDVLNSSKHLETQELVTGIVASQQAETDSIEQWRKAWYNQ